MANYDISVAARRDIAHIQKRSELAFGNAAANRYGYLIYRAIHELAGNPYLIHSEQVKGKQLRIYHLQHARERAVLHGQIVKKPRHYIVYSLSRPGWIEVVRVLHDQMELKRHLP